MHRGYNKLRGAAFEGKKGHFISLLPLGSPQYVTQFGSEYQKLEFIMLKRQEIKPEVSPETQWLYHRAEELRFEYAIDLRHSALF
jgi:hypothetical protein